MRSVFTKIRVIIRLKMQITCAIFVIFIAYCKTTNQSNINRSSTFKENNSDDAFTEIRCHTKAHLHTISYIWHIDHFDFQKPTRQAGVVQNLLISPTFSSASSDKVKWYLEIGLHGETSDNLIVHLKSSSSEINGTITRAKYTISFLDSKRKLLKKYTFPVCTFCSAATGWGWNIPVKEVVSPDDTLNIICEIVFCEYTNNSLVYCNRTDTTSKPECNRSQDIVPSTDNSELPNVVLLISKNGKEYPVKKDILAAHSPLFAAMLEDEMESSEEIKRVDMTDVDEQVFGELIKYIYTNRSENIGKMGADLLIVADKYGMNSLKTICVKQLSKNLTVENVVDTLLLADRHDFDELKSNAIQFLVANYAQVSITKDWKHVVKTNDKSFHKVFEILSNRELSDEEIAEE